MAVRTTALYAPDHLDPDLHWHYLCTLPTGSGASEWVHDLPKTTIMGLIPRFVMLVLWAQAGCITLHAQELFMPQRVYLGLGVGGGISAIFNHNTFGLPKMDYNPSGVQTLGINAGYAPQPWNRIQVGFNWMRGEYRYSDSYGVYARSSEPEMDMAKSISVSYFQVPVTFRHFLYDQNKLMALRRREVMDEMNRENVFYLLGGLQFSFLRTGDMQIRKRSAATGNQWRNADLADLKPVFDSFLPVSRIPDALPEDRRELFSRFLIEAVVGIGWKKKLGPSLDLGLEGYGTISINDLNSAARATDGSYAWRRPYYLRNKPYAAAHLASLGLYVVMNVAL